MPGPIDTLPFQQIAMDLITGLPRSKGHDAILTIVDHGCSRAAVFLPTTTEVTGPEIARLYFYNLYKWFGLPDKIISDRDPRFTSHFAKALLTLTKTSPNVSTAYHPQMDGLLERKNQWVKQYLRLMTMGIPEDWRDWLTLALAVHNSNINQTTGLLPNQILFGYQPHLITTTDVITNNEEV